MYNPSDKELLSIYFRKNIECPLSSMTAATKGEAIKFTTVKTEKFAKVSLYLKNRNSIKMKQNLSGLVSLRRVGGE